MADTSLARSRAPEGRNGGFTFSLHDWIRAVLPTRESQRAGSGVAPAALPVHSSRGAPGVKSYGVCEVTGLGARAGLKEMPGATVSTPTSPVCAGSTSSPPSVVAPRMPVDVVDGDSGKSEEVQEQMEGGRRGSGGAARRDPGEVPSLFGGGLDSFSNFADRAQTSSEYRGSIPAESGKEHMEFVCEDQNLEAEVELGEIVDNTVFSRRSQTDLGRLRAAGFGGRFWCLADDEQSDEEEAVTSVPASTPPPNVIHHGNSEKGWSAPICRRRQPEASRRSKQIRPLVVDGQLRRPTRRWINLGSACRDHRPPPLHNLGDVFAAANIQFAKSDGGVGSRPSPLTTHGTRVVALDCQKAKGSDPSPLSPQTLSSHDLDPIFNHIWVAAHRGERQAEEWPRVGVGDGSAQRMYRGNGGGGQRPWQGGGGRPPANFNNTANFNNNNNGGNFNNSNSSGNFNNTNSNGNFNNTNSNGNFNNNAGNYRNNNWRNTVSYKPKVIPTQTASDPGKAPQGSASGGSGTGTSANPAVSTTATSPEAQTTNNGGSGKKAAGSGGNQQNRKIYCQKCTSDAHTTQECKEKLLCDICTKTSHATGACVLPNQPKPVIQLVGFGAKGLGCFYVQSIKKVNNGNANIMVMLQVKNGAPSVLELEAGLERSFQAKWDWKVKQIDSKRFLVKFPSNEVLDRVLGFDDFTLKGTGVSVSVTKWSSASMAKAKLYSTWIRIGGIPDELMHYKGVCEAASPLGVVQEVDIPALVKFQQARARVGVRDPELVPPSAEITTDPYIYDAYYDVEEVVEQGGLLDGNGILIEGSSFSHLMDLEEDNLNKKQKASGESSSMMNNNGTDPGNEERFLFTKEELAKLIQEETEKRVVIEVQKMEERILASQLRNNLKRARIDESEQQETQGEKSLDLTDYESSQNAAATGERTGTGDEEEVMNTQEYEAALEKKCREMEMEQDASNKNNKAIEDENIRQRLRPHGDGKVMDKAKELANKKNTMKETKGGKSSSARN